MSMTAARNRFLDMMRKAQWSERHEGNGSATHTLTVSDRDLALLADALGITPKLYETTALAISRHMKTEAA